MELSTQKKLVRWCVCAIAVLAVPFLSPKASAQVSHLVISQVYGGGGNSGATYQNDFVELFNPTGSTISLTNKSVQYLANSLATTTVVTLSGSIAAGHYYLIKLASGGATGAALPTEDLSATTLNLAATGGNIFLCNTVTPLTAGSCPVSAAIIDKVGYGTGATTCPEGSNTGNPGNATAAIRAGSGCTDSDNNSTDFSISTPTPRNSSSAAVYCYPTKFVITSISPNPPTAGVGFSVTVQAQDAGSNVHSVIAGTSFTLTTNGTAGSISGTVTGTIAAGTSSVTVTGVTLATGTGGAVTANITATRTAGDILTAATSSNFSVNAATCSGMPSAGTASPSPASLCSSGSSALSLTGATLGAGVTYQWSSNTTNTPPGANIAGATSNTYTTPVISATTYYWCTTTCTSSSLSNISAVGTVSVNPVPTVTVTPPSGLAGVTITAGGATTYSWLPTAGLSASAGATVTATPTVTTVYTVTGAYTSGCTGTNTVNVICNSGVVTWDFTAGTHTATTSSNANVPVAGCTVTPGNANGTLASSVNSTSASSGYTDASGGNNIGDAAAVAGNTTFNAATSPYFDFLITPNSGYCLTVTDMSFGERGTATGPASYTISSDAAGYGVPVATGSLAATSSWAYYTPAITNIIAAPGNAVNIRLYGYNGTGSPVTNIINWRLDDITFNYTAKPFPSLAGASNGGAVCATATLSLFANTPANVAGYNWSGPNSFTSTLQNPTISSATTAASGVYTVVVNNGTGCTATYTTTATVNPMPSSTGATNSGPVCLGAGAVLSANSTNATAWAWSGPAGYTATVQNPSLTPTATGTYSLTISNTATGCSPAAVYTTTLTVNPVPVSSGATNNGPICNGSTVTLSANSSNATAWSWSGPAGYTSTIQNPTLSPTATGTYSLTVSSTGTGCSPATVYTTTVTVSPVPTAAPTNNGPICNGATATLTANSSNASSWSWSGPGGFTSALQNPTDAPTATGIYSLTVSSTGLGCSPATVYTTTVTVNAVPAAAPINNGPICNGATATLTANSSNATAWLWNGPAGFTSSLQNPTDAPTATGTYSLTVSSTGLGCSPATVYTTTVTVNAVPTAAPTNNGPICNGATATLTANSSNATAWSWSGPGGFTSSLQNPTDAPTATGTYSLTVSSTGLGCSPATVYTTTVTVNAVPTAAPTNNGPICNGATATLTANSSNATAWSWNGPAGFTSSLQNPTDAPTATGTYSLTVSSTGLGCSPATVYTTTVTVNAVPTAAPTNNGPICNGATATLTANSSNATAWSWSGPAGFTSSLQNPTDAPTASGTYSLTVSSTGLGCSPATVYTTTVTVNAVPTAAPTNNGPICNGATATLTANSSNATAWSWNGPGSFTSSLQNPTDAPTASGIYSLTVSSTGLGCSPATVYTTTVTVNAVPAAGPTNNGPICTGATVSLTANSSDATSWSWNGPAGFTSSLQNPTDAPTATGTYSLTVSSTGLGCSPATVYTTTVTVNPLPSVGASANVAICAGSSTPLSATGAATYMWSPGTGLSATTGSSVTASPGVTTTYTVTGTSAATCTNTAMVTVTVNPLPTVSAGADVAICAGTSTPLTATGAASYSWSPAAGLSATTGSAITATPAVTTTYTVTGSSAVGCINTAMVTVTVNTLPVLSTSGNVAICFSSSTTLTASGAATYSWSPATGLSATTGSSITASPAATTIYTVTGTSAAGCYSNAMLTVTVNPLPDAGSISGAPTVCSGSNTTFTDMISGGAWSSSDMSIATVNPGGVATGVAAGNAVISYSVTNICGTAVATAALTVNPLPNAGTITGAASVCAGSTTTFTDGVTGGVWTSSTTAVATAGTSGIITGVAAGVAIISYTYTNVCGSASATKAFTVNPLPDAGTLSGPATVCTGSVIGISSTATGGAWSSSNTAVATIGTTGTVTGITAGNVAITYTYTNVCGTAIATIPVTVNAATGAGTITGTALVCIGGTTALSSAVTGGVWSSANDAMATVGTTGIVSGVATGIATISYAVSGTCGSAYATRQVTVGLLPDAGVVSGASIVGVGSTLPQLDANAGGTWAVDNAHATISATGVVTGVTPGTTTVSYTFTSGCGSSTATKVITVNAAVGTIRGPLHVCLGSIITLTNTAGGGTWSSRSPSVASITTAGVVTGLVSGTTVISYTISGVANMVTVTVDPIPGLISGGTKVCPNATLALTDTSAGGTWGSSNNSIANVSGGVVTGLTTGTIKITYLLATGCFTAPVITVNPLPAAIGGAAAVCQGTTATLTDATAGISWSSNTPAVATITNGGVISGVTLGTTRVTYTISTGCYITAVISVNPVPAAITGTASICPANATTLSSATAGGTWTSGNTAIAAAGLSSGVISGIATGTSIITYIAGGCRATNIVTVKALPAAIAGTPTVCISSNTTLSSTAGGTWASSASGVASIGTTGIVSGISAGTSIITYTLTSTGCIRTATVTVNAAPAIVGTTTICNGSAVTLTPPATGGTWSSSNTSVATIASTGVLTGVANGSANITYNINATCRSITTVAVITNSPVITGVAAICLGSTTTFADATPSGVWSSSNASVAPVGAGTGVITGAAAGSATITYTTAAGCYRTKSINIGSPLGSISGSTGICTGATTNLTYSTNGLSWTSSTTSVATVNATSGLVKGIAPGTTVITFTPYASSANAGCVATTIVTVDAASSLPAITGVPYVAVGATTLLSESTPGGTWSSANTASATVTSGGLVTGVSPDLVPIRYSISNGVCYQVATLVVHVVASKPADAAETELPQAEMLRAYPNPTSGTFTLEAPTDGTFAIYTTDGREMQRSLVSKGANTISLAGNAAAGIYMCRYTGTNGNVIAVRIIYQP